MEVVYTTKVEEPSDCSVTQLAEWSDIGLV